MNETGKIPLTVGVTGHIDLREQDHECLFQSVKNELSRLQEQYPHTPVRMINSLAAGGDLLCAEAGEKLGIPVTAVLPMALETYQQDFDEASLAKLHHQLDRAEAVFVATAAEAEPEEPGRDYQYRQAGIYIAEHCHILLALWDGEENGSDCGTAAAIRFALEGEWKPDRGIPVRSAENCLVIHIGTPRANDSEKNAGEVRRLGDEQAWHTLMERTEEFNRLAENVVPEGTSLLPEKSEKDDPSERMERMYQAADALSMTFARQYRRSLAGLALAGTMLTLAFLMYDEAELTPMILVCGAALIFAAYLLRRTRRTACHRRFIEYRMLAETLRVQLFLRHAGSRLEIQRLMPLTQRYETPWILCAVCAMNASAPPEGERNILACWAEHQRTYHGEAGQKTKAQQERKERILGIAMKTSILFYLITLAYELVFGGMLFSPPVPLRNPETGRTIIKIVLGTISAGTLFMAGYYGKMSLDRITGDHEKMERFYQKAADLLARCGQNEQILETLAREELTENGNWSSYQRDNAPEMNV